MFAAAVCINNVRLKLYAEINDAVRYLLKIYFREGRLKTGDRIVALDGTQMTSFCLEEANRAIANCGDEAVLTVEYDVSVMGKRKP